MKAKYSIIPILLLLCMFSSLAHAKNKDTMKASDIVGLWISSVRAMDGVEKGTSLITEIFEKDNKYYAYGFAYTGTSANKEMLKDIHNPDPQHRGRSLSETVFLYNLEFNGKSWEKGHIYRVYDGKTFYAKGNLSKDMNTLSIKGTIDSMGVLGKTFEWTRITDPEMIAKYNAMKTERSILEKNIPNSK